MNVQQRQIEVLVGSASMIKMNALEFFKYVVNLRDEWEEVVKRNPSSSKYLNLVTSARFPEMCDKAVEKDPRDQEHVPDYFKTQEMCDRAVERVPRMLKHVPNRLKTREMCLKAIEENVDNWKYVPREWFCA